MIKARYYWVKLRFVYIPLPILKRVAYYIKIIHAYADNSGIYYNRHLRVVFIEDLVLFDVDPRLKDCGKDDPEPSA